MVIDQSAYIDGIELYEVEIPLKNPFQISGGTLYQRISLIIKITDGQNTGYGESAPFTAPFYSSETISTVKAVLIENIFPRFIGKEISSIEQFNNLLRENIRGNNFAKAGIETAYWDLIARKNNVSIKQLISAKLEQMNTPASFLQNQDWIASGVSVGIPESRDISQLQQRVEEYVNEGYQRIKIKIKPGWDIEVVKAVRDVIGSDFPFWVDANSAYVFPDDLDTLQKLDQFNCLFIEQPLHHNDIIDHSKLSHKLKTPLCLDESLKNADIGRKVIELGSAAIWNIKLQRVGGLLEGCKIYKLAVDNGIKLWGGTMPESGIGAMFIIALASLKGFSFPSDVEPSRRWYGPGRDLIEVEMDAQGRIYVNEESGIGSIDERYLHKMGTLIYQEQAD